MRFAIPVTGEVLEPHFGHCEKIAFIDAAEDSKSITAVEFAPTPKNDHSRLPAFIKERGATHVIAGGMGVGMQAGLEDAAIKVFYEAPSEKPEEVVRKFLSGELQLSE